MTHEIRIEDGEDFHAITVFKPPLYSPMVMNTESVGVHPAPSQHYARRFTVDGDSLLADYISSIPEGTPTLKETFRTAVARDHPGFEEHVKVHRRATREVGP